MNQDKFAPMAVNEFFSWLECNISPNTKLYEVAHSYMDSERIRSQRPLENDAPFLSVITRTQGKRPDMLVETLLSLTGQSNTDFELLIMGHNLTDEQHQTVSGIISDLPDWMREKTRLIPVTGGTRTTPLNMGFEAAKGEYIAVLDDDDLVFDHWVETFYRMSLKNKGVILHSYTVIQDWEVVGGDFPNTPRAARAPKNTYCCDFDLIQELTLNKCPLCALAFPAYAYKHLGIRFDETLTTTEDWDFLMRTAFITGVANDPNITFLYRNWLNAENSASLHQKEEWMKNYKYVVNRFRETPIIMPVGSLDHVYEDILGEEIDSFYTDDVDMTELFYNDGEGFLQEKSWRRVDSSDKEKFPYVYSPGRNGARGIAGIRFDPAQYGGVSLEQLEIQVEKSDGESVMYSLADVSTNGYVVNDMIVFLKNDPQITLDFGEPIDVKEVRIGCIVHEHVEDMLVDSVISGQIAAALSVQKPKRSLPYRAVRKIYRAVRKIFGIS